MLIDIKLVSKYSINEVVYHAFVDDRGIRRRVEGEFPSRKSAIEAGMKQREANESRWSI